MNVATALAKAAQQLACFDSAQLDAVVLLAFVLKKSKEFLYAYPRAELSWIQKIRFFYLIGKRKKNWPVAYLTGSKAFYGRDFFVNKSVLIPRPLTEELIDFALKLIPKAENRIYAVADIGTGSGNIIITLIKELQKQNHDLGKFKFYALDVSQKALQVARRNARLYQVDRCIHFLKGNLLQPLKNLPINLLLANLPYLDSADLNEPSIKKEPKPALVGSYDQFFKQLFTFHSNPTLIYEDKSGVHLYKNSSRKNA